MIEEQVDLHDLIERYNREMMAQYASVSASDSNVHTATPSVVSVSSENQTDIDETALIDIGRLQVRVSTENQAIPLPGAVITVTRKNNAETELIRTLIADENGLTPLLDLPTKDRRLSQEPNHPEPYAVYTVDVTADGYYPKRFINLPIYGGVTAVQNVSMIPLPENGDKDAVLSYPLSTITSEEA